MTQRFGQRRRTEHLDVVVGVDVDQPGHHPFAVGVDDLGQSVSSSACAYGGDVAVADADIADGRGCAGSVEPAPVADDGVVGHQVIEQRVLAGVNEIREQILKNVYFRC